MNTNYKIVCRCGNKKVFLSFYEKKRQKKFVIGFINKQIFSDRFERKFFIFGFHISGKNKWKTYMTFSQKTNLYWFIHASQRNEANISAVHVSQEKLSILFSKDFFQIEFDFFSICLKPASWIFSCNFLFIEHIQLQLKQLLSFLRKTSVHGSENWFFFCSGTWQKCEKKDVPQKGKSFRIFPIIMNIFWNKDAGIKTGGKSWIIQRCFVHV